LLSEAVLYGQLFLIKITPHGFDHLFYSQMAAEYPVLIDQWRQRVSQSQAEARRVIAEMRTPGKAQAQFSSFLTSLSSAGMNVNCYAFVGIVTGLSHQTIARVSAQLKASGGDREPLGQHGLKLFWHNYAQQASLEEGTLQIFLLCSPSFNGVQKLHRRVP
jgi:hypothetical protein